MLFIGRMKNQTNSTDSKYITERIQEVEQIKNDATSTDRRVLGKLL